MKINSFKTYVRAGWLALAALAVSFGSCTREDQPNATEEQAAGAVSQARSYYESTARPLTRTVGGEAGTPGVDINQESSLASKAAFDC